MSLSTLGNMFSKLTTIIAVLLLCSGISGAAGTVQVVGLFKDRAVVVIDGKRSILTVGQAGRAGVYLISADSNSAVLDVDGVQGVYTPESLVHAPLGVPNSVETSIRRDEAGLFNTIGSINGRLFSMLVDTGATQIAMNEHHADRLGIKFRIIGTPVRVTTASGEEQVYRVNLKVVRVGEVQLQDVAALVLEGNYPDKVLLGMSFLKRVNMQNQGDRLVLRKKF